MYIYKIIKKAIFKQSLKIRDQENEIERINGEVNMLRRQEEQLEEQLESANNEINILKDKNKILSIKIKEKEGYSSIFLSPWTDTWKEYFLNKVELIDSNMQVLKRNLDKESLAVVDNLWEKIIFQIPYNRYKKSFLYKIKDFYTEKEISAKNNKADLSKYNFPDSAIIENSVFLNKNGLVFLDKDIVNRIEGSIVVDGGGYIGDSAIVFSEYNPLKIYSFEPVPEIYSKLKETISLNNMQNMIEPVRLGLSDKESDINIYGKDSTASIYSKFKKIPSKMHTTTIDNFFEKINERIGLIKLDVEGAESSVMRGAISMIKKHKPILLIAVYHRPEDFFDIKPMIEDLNLGYKFLVRKTSPTRVTSETILIGYVE